MEDGKFLPLARCDIKRKKGLQQRYAVAPSDNGRPKKI